VILPGLRLLVSRQHARLIRWMNARQEQHLAGIKLLGVVQQTAELARPRHLPRLQVDNVIPQPGHLLGILQLLLAL